MRQTGVVTAVFAACLFAACEQPKDEEAEKPAAVDEDVLEEVISVPPTVSEDAPSEPHKGEPPSPSQPQPVVPDDVGAAMDADEPEAVEVMEEIISVPPTVSEDAPSEPHKGEPPSPNQPQPVVPDDAASAMDSDEPEPTSPNQPQPVYPEGEPEDL